MAAAGTVLTVLGGPSILLGGVGLFVAESDGGAGPMGNLLFGGALLAGVALCGIGIPLIYVGARRVPVDDPRFASPPLLRIGAGSVDFSMEL